LLFLQPARCEIEKCRTPFTRAAFLLSTGMIDRNGALFCVFVYRAGVAPVRNIIHLYAYPPQFADAVGVHAAYCALAFTEADMFGVVFSLVCGAEHMPRYDFVVRVVAGQFAEAVDEIMEHGCLFCVS
jgi:hypothetical protein